MLAKHRGFSSRHVEMSAGQGFRLFCHFCMSTWIDTEVCMHRQQLTASIGVSSIWLEEVLGISPRSLGLCHESSSVPVSDRSKRTIVFGSSGEPADGGPPKFEQYKKAHATMLTSCFT